MSPKTAAWLERVRGLAAQTYPRIKGLNNEIEDSAGRRRDILHSLSDLHTLIMSPGAKSGLGRNEMRAVKKLFALGATAVRLAGLQFDVPNVAKEKKTLVVPDTRHLDEFIESIDPEEFRNIVDLLGTRPLSHPDRGRDGDKAPRARRSNADRNKFIFAATQKGTPLKKILKTVNETDGWSRLKDESGIRHAYVRYCKHHGNSPESRK